MEIAILAAGCFWSPEIKFSKLNGVLKTEVGSVSYTHLRAHET